MRSTRPAALIAALGLLVTAVGCSAQVSGTPRPDPTTVPLAVSEDGFGIVAGFAEATASIEIFTEPQCTHCADLQHDFGDQIAYQLNVGALQVTYRPLTFLDDTYDGYSATVANALFLATEAIDNSAATGAQFQRFVERLWADQDPGGQPFSADELRDMAAGAGITELIADNIAADKDAIDIADLDDNNFSLLLDVDPVDTGTPTVFDLNAGEKIDISDDDWLTDLVNP